MGSKREALTPQTATAWAQMAHALYLEALMAEADWQAGDVAFHGGTSLRLSWNSPRHSEDLDFLLSSQAEGLGEITRRVELRLREMMRRIDPEFVVQIQDRTKDALRMPVFMVSVTHPGFVGSAKVKAEFWRTDPAYLRRYPTQQRMPNGQASRLSHFADPLYDVYALTSNPVPAAALETAYADKLVAFATRPFLKWRDIYDLWWIGTQTPAELDLQQISAQFLHNVTAYTPLQGLEPVRALALFLDKPRATLVAAADPDLKIWLPEQLWRRLHPQGVQEMVDYVRHALTAVIAHVEGGDLEGESVDLKSVPRMR